jgi:urea carboxylase/acetyl-CoA carboxylase biotin carboxyl carrier protein
MSLVPVVAEMTASVTRVGGAVTEGDPLIVVESMKMEIPILAPAAGRVAEIRVEPDDLIAEGDTLVVIEGVA